MPTERQITVLLVLGFASGRARVGAVALAVVIEPRRHARPKPHGSGFANVRVAAAAEELTTLGGTPTVSYVIGDDIISQSAGSAPLPLTSYLLYDGHRFTWHRHHAQPFTDPDALSPNALR